MIRAIAAAGAALTTTVIGSPVTATGFSHVLQPGRYQIEVIAEDPASGRQKVVRHVERCLQRPAIANHVIFEMLSDTPASHCPKYEICAGDVRTGFLAHCIPASPTSAVGMFALEPDNFRGRIEVKDAEDRITNVEIQYGRRLGGCQLQP